MSAKKYDNVFMIDMIAKKYKISQKNTKIIHTLNNHFKLLSFYCYYFNFAFLFVSAI